VKFQAVTQTKTSISTTLLDVQTDRTLAVTERQTDRQTDQ